MKFFVISFLMLFFACMPALAQPPYQIQTDQALLGAGANSINKSLIFDLGLGSSNPVLRANISTNVIEFANDGSTFNQIATAANGNPAGTLIQFAGTSCPASYLAADGMSYLQTTYPALYAAIGTAYGAMDGSHFNVPDMRGQFARGVISATLGGTISLVSGNTMTITGHGFNHSGIQVWIVSGTPPGGLSSATSYYVIYIDANTFQLAASQHDAISGTAITLSDTTTGAFLIQQVDALNTASRLASAFGGSSGGNVGSSQMDQLQGHAHGIIAPGGALADNYGSDIPLQRGGGGTSPDLLTTNIVSDGTNGTPNVGFETRAKNIYVLYCIKE